MEITECPTCGSSKIQKIQGPVTHEFKGETYTTPDITFYDCPDCGEQIYDAEAVSKLQATWPAFRKRRKVVNH